MAISVSEVKEILTESLRDLESVHLPYAIESNRNVDTVQRKTDDTRSALNSLEQISDEDIEKYCTQVDVNGWSILSLVQAIAE